MLVPREYNNIVRWVQHRRCRRAIGCRPGLSHPPVLSLVSRSVPAPGKHCFIGANCTNYSTGTDTEHASYIPYNAVLLWVWLRTICRIWLRINNSDPDPTHKFYRKLSSKFFFKANTETSVSDPYLLNPDPATE